MNLTAITVSCNYSDFFCWAAPINKPHFTKWIVITDTKDKLTKQICNYYNIQCIQTDVFYENSSFNKYAGINIGLEKTKEDDFVMFLDSDIVLNPMTRRVLDNLNLQKDCIYGTDRINLKGFEQWLEFMNNPKIVFDNWLINTGGYELGSRIVHYYGQQGDNGKYGGWSPLGFLQIAHKSQFNRYPDNCQGADHCDMTFARQWVRDKRIFIPELFPLHLESDDATWGKNWNSRKSLPFSPKQYDNNSSVNPLIDPYEG